MNAMNRLKNLIKGLDKTLHLLRVEGEFQKKFQNLVTLATSPLVQGLIKSFNVDTAILDTVFNALQHDQQVLDIVETIANIFECFSVDRFVGVNSERELEDKAAQLNEKKLYLAGVFFNNTGGGLGASRTDYAYTLRMDIDNTPITLENKNRFWFPGPDGNFELQMRYHRGFIQIQHLVDQAIVKTVVARENNELKKLWESTTTVAPTTTTTEATTTTEEPVTTTETPTTTTPRPDTPEVVATEQTVKGNGTFSIREVPPNATAHEITHTTEVKLTTGLNLPSNATTPLVANSTASKESPFSGSDETVETRKIPKLSIINNSTAVTTPKSHIPVVNTTAADETAHLDAVYNNITSKIDTTKIDLKLTNDTLEDYLDFKDEEPTKVETIKEIPAEEAPGLDKTLATNEALKSDDRAARKKRSPQFDGLLGLILGGGGGDAGSAKSTASEFSGGFKVDDFQVFTKQFPYPKYRKDSFVTGLYLAQSVQLAFFFALIVQVSAAVRNRIWMRESGNSTVSVLKHTGEGLFMSNTAC